MKYLFLPLVAIGALIGCSKNSSNEENNDGNSSTESVSLEQWLLNNGYDKNNNSKIDLTEVNSIKELNVAGKKLKDLKALSLFSSLEVLDASNNYISEIDFPYQSRNLKKIDVHNNQLIKLDISQCYLLESLNAKENPGLQCVRVNNSQKDRQDWSIDSNTSLDPNCVNGQRATEPISLEEYLLKNGYDTNKNGIIDSAEADNIKTLSLVGRRIKDLTGIEKLRNLETLDLSNNELTEATIALESLANLNISSNDKLTKLDISGSIYIGMGIFTSLNNKNLTCIKVNNNQQSLPKLKPNTFRVDSHTTLSVTGC
ncbi:MAG: leucine-rich repeat domain-containing protein [Capnocytophaga sp.]|nr:leucine-rich repeat domain-containing protein [Capnocytophaga sp.]